MGQAKRKGTLEDRIALSKSNALKKKQEREAQEALALEMMTDELWDLTYRRNELRWKHRRKVGLFAAAVLGSYTYVRTPSGFRR